MCIPSCPFCGSNDLGVGRGSEDREGFPTYIFCGECGMQGPWAYTRSTDIALICEITGWDKRSIKTDVRRFGGNFDTLCEIGAKGCPFVKITSDSSAFCSKYNEVLKYIETGNNDLCYRCKACIID